MPSQKGFSLPVIIFSVIFLVLIGIAIFFVNSNFDISVGLDHFIVIKKFKFGGDYKTKADFQVFTHPSKGFTFEYPLNWRIKNQTGDIYGHSTDFYLCSDYYCSNPNLGNKIMNLTIIDSPLETVKANYPQATSISIGSKTGLNDGNKILIPLGSSDSSVALLTFENNEEISHVISTIKFSELSKIDDPQHWPIYEDKLNGFSFPYAPIFKIENLDDSGVRLIYDNEKAVGLPPTIPPKIALEVKVIQTQEKADAYAEAVINNLRQDPNYSDVAMSITADSINSKNVYKVFTSPKNDLTPGAALGYFFVNLDKSVLEIKAYYVNTESLTLTTNYVNILDQTIYKLKF